MQCSTISEPFLLFSGFGVFALMPFEKKDFLLHYRGRLLPAEVANAKANQDFLHYFRAQEKNLWYDLKCSTTSLLYYSHGCGIDYITMAV